MRPFLLLICSLVLGFATGWFAHAHKADSSPKTTPVSPLASLELAKDTALPSSPTPSVETTAPGVSDSFSRRVEAIRELKPFGFMLHLRAFGRDGFDPKLFKLLGLTPETSSLLAEAAQEANRDIIAARLTRASSRTSNDGGLFIVEVPSIEISASRAIYDRLLNTVKVTLGTEKYKLFSELTGESFDQGFDQFGLNTFRYEAVVPPNYDASIGQTIFTYKRHYLDATGNASGWSGSHLNYDGIRKHDPILAHFIPPELRKRQ